MFASSLEEPEPAACAEVGAAATCPAVGDSAARRIHMARSSSGHRIIMTVIQEHSPDGRHGEGLEGDPQAPSQLTLWRTSLKRAALEYSAKVQKAVMHGVNQDVFLVRCSLFNVRKTLLVSTLPRCRER